MSANFLHFCTRKASKLCDSKASKVSTCRRGEEEVDAVPKNFVVVKQVSTCKASKVGTCLAERKRSTVPKNLVVDTVTSVPTFVRFSV